MPIKCNQTCLLAIALIGALFTTGCRWDYYETVERPENVSFSDDIMPIFNESCNMSGCHAPAFRPPDLSPANAYSALMNTSGMVNTTDPAQSELYVRMNAVSSPMPTDGKLPQIKVTAVLVWIEEGAQDN